MISRWARAGAAVAAALLVLTGCGDDDPAETASDPSSSSAAPDDAATSSEAPDEPTSTETAPEPTETEPAVPLPACGDIWVADGRKLPGRYRGCTDGGTDVPAESRSCSFGQPLVTYANRFYAVPRGPINETQGALAQDPDYKSALASCTA